MDYNAGSIIIQLDIFLVIMIGFKSRYNRGAWVAQSFKHLTPDFSSGHGLTVWEFEPRVGLWADSVEPAWDFLSPSTSAPRSPLMLSLKINKIEKKIK